MALQSETLPRTANDIAFDALLSGGLGGSMVALFFLAIDVIEGHALFTPTLMGSVLFGGMQGHQPLLDTWEWDGTSWKQATPVSSPSCCTRRSCTRGIRSW